MKKPQPQLGVMDQGFVMGVASAVAMLLKHGEDTYAREIWQTLGYDFVPQCVESFDAKPIRKALKTWNNQ